MKTKFDIGEKVLVEAKVIEIKINQSGTVKYVLDNENWTNLETFEEKDIIEQLKKHKLSENHGVYEDED